MATATSGGNMGEEADDKPGRDDIDVAKLAVAAIGVVTAAAALIGGFTGGIARVARNGPSELPLDVFLVFAATLAALIAALIGPFGGDSTKRRRWLVLQRILLVVALALFAFASIRVASALSNSLAKPDRPIINATWVSMDGGWTLKGSVTASGLKTSDKMTIVVGRIVVTRNEPPPTLTATPGATEAPDFQPPPRFALYAGTVYKQVVGADLDGNAAVSLEVPLPENYDGLQVSANLGDTMLCPVDDEEFNDAQLSCLTLDAPSWAAPAPTD